MSLMDCIRQLPVSFQVDLPGDHSLYSRLYNSAAISCHAISTERGCVVAVTRSDDGVCLRQAVKILGTADARFVQPHELAPLSCSLLDVLPPFGSLLGWKTVVDVQASACPVWRLGCGSYDLLLESQPAIEFEEALVAPLSFETFNDGPLLESLWDDDVVSQRIAGVSAHEELSVRHVG